MMAAQSPGTRRHSDVSIHSETEDEDYYEDHDEARQGDAAVASPSLQSEQCDQREPAPEPHPSRTRTTSEGFPLIADVRRVVGEPATRTQQPFVKLSRPDREPTPGASHSVILGVLDGQRHMLHTRVREPAFFAVEIRRSSTLIRTT
jgi:hypothetical protein